MKRWNLDATVLKYYPNADGNGDFEIEIHEHMWDPLVNTANLRWETLNYLKESNMNDVHLELVWNCFNETIGKRIVTRSPWEQAGWWTMCHRWITENLRLKNCTDWAHVSITCRSEQSNSFFGDRYWRVVFQIIYYLLTMHNFGCT